MNEPLLHADDYGYFCPPDLAAILARTSNQPYPLIADALMVSKWVKPPTWLRLKLTGRL